MNKFKKFIGFFRENLWRVPEAEISAFNRIVLGQIRVVALAIRGSGEDKIFQKASALTYYTLWALIPVLALLFGIAKGFGFQDVFDSFLMHQFEGQPEVAQQMIELANKYLETIKGGFLVGAGIVILVWSVLNVLGQVETVFNSIWQNPKARSFLRKFTDYFALLIIIPIIIIISSGANIFIMSSLEKISAVFKVDFVIAPLAKFTAKTIPYLLYIILFTLLYLIIPNTRVRFTSALIPGIIAGLLFQLLQMLYFNSQVWFGRMHAIYSGLVAIPLLMLYAQIGWTIILMGAEISFSHQNINNFMYNNQIAKISTGYQRKLTLFITYIIVKRFKNGHAALSSEQIADHHGIPIRLVNRVIIDLSGAGIITEIASDDHLTRTYQPGVDINKLTIQYIEQRLDSLGTNDFVPIKTPEFKHLSAIIDEEKNKLNKAETNLLLMDL